MNSLLRNQIGPQTYQGIGPQLFQTDDSYIDGNPIDSGASLNEINVNVSNIQDVFTSCNMQKYILGKLIGTGNNKVYLGKDTSTNTNVAIKVVKLTTENVQDFVKNCRLEYQTSIFMASNGIGPEIYDACLLNNKLFILVMELFEGDITKILSGKIRSSGKIFVEGQQVPNGMSLSICSLLCSMELIQKQLQLGVMCHDQKPENILFVRKQDQSGNVNIKFRLSDFGGNMCFYYDKNNREKFYVNIFFIMYLFYLFTKLFISKTDSVTSNFIKCYFQTIIKDVYGNLISINSQYQNPQYLYQQYLSFNSTRLRQNVIHYFVTFFCKTNPTKLGINCVGDMTTLAVQNIPNFLNDIITCQA